MGNNLAFCVVIQHELCCLQCASGWNQDEHMDRNRLGGQMHERKTPKNIQHQVASRNIDQIGMKTFLGATVAVPKQSRNFRVSGTNNIQENHWIVWLQGSLNYPFWRIKHCEFVVMVRDLHWFAFVRIVWVGHIIAPAVGGSFNECLLSCVAKQKSVAQSCLALLSIRVRQEHCLKALLSSFSQHVASWKEDMDSMAQMCHLFASWWLVTLSGAAGALRRDASFSRLCFYQPPHSTPCKDGCYALCWQRLAWDCQCSPATAWMSSQGLV